MRFKDIIMIVMAVLAAAVVIFAIIKCLRRIHAYRYAEKIKHMIYDKRIVEKGPKIVVIGGGTGLSTLLRGLKQYTANITAVVTVADDGGSSGKLREDLGILPPGDIRNCILALSDMEPDMEQLLQYRFKEGQLKGQNLGNLLIAAMTDISNGFEKAIQQLSNVLAIKGRVLPVTLENIKLHAVLKDGTLIDGESHIPVVQIESQSPIDKVFISPPNCTSLPEVLQAIHEADAIGLGPGSLYTSIIPNLLVNEVRDGIYRSTAIKIYVCNVMTQPGETTDYSVIDHVDAIIKHCGKNMIDWVVVNNNIVPDDILSKYELEGAKQVLCDKNQIIKLRKMGIQVVQGNLIDYSKGLVRHNSEMLAKNIMELVLDYSMARDRLKRMDYFYFKDLIRGKDKNKQGRREYNMK